MKATKRQLGPAKASLALAINTFDEGQAQLTQCFRRVRCNLNDAVVHVFVNGSDKSHAALASHFAFNFSIVPNYGNNRLWYLWWKRMLEWFLTTDATRFLKIDPDTMVDCPPKRIPEADYFGCIDDWFIQGGITGLSRRLASKLLAENLLCRSKARECAVTRRAFADDKYLGRLLSTIGVTPTQWNEVYSQWRVPYPNDPLRFSIVHPRFYE